jgi:hypothetical protein
VGDPIRENPAVPASRVSTLQGRGGRGRIRGRKQRPLEKQKLRFLPQLGDKHGFPYKQCNIEVLHGHTS